MLKIILGWGGLDMWSTLNQHSLFAYTLSMCSVNIFTWCNFSSLGPLDKHHTVVFGGGFSHADLTTFLATPLTVALPLVHDSHLTVAVLTALVDAASKACASCEVE